MAWVKRYPGTITLDVGVVIFTGTAAQNSAFLLGVDNSLSLYASAWNNDLRSTAAINNNQWTHLAVTYDGSGIMSSPAVQGYINGAVVTLVNAAGPSGQAVTTTGNAYSVGAPIGRTGYNFNGEVANLQIYDRALSATEISVNCKVFVDRFDGASCEN